MIPPMMPPISPPFTDRIPVTTPATMATSPMPDTCLAATVATITGRASIMMLKIFSKYSSPGTLLRIRVRAMAMNPGRDAIRIPRTLIRDRRLPCSPASPAVTPPFMAGR